MPFYLNAATKEEITDIDVIHVKQDALDYALECFKQDVENYDAMKKGIIKPDRCEKCEYCKLTKILKKPTESDEYYLL